MVGAGGYIETDQFAEVGHLQLPEIPAAVGTACGLRSGPPARFEAWQRSASLQTRPTL
ncbi:hypothetical protein FD28_GL002379 [Levilactobacillus hammesii DSM 16381]|uniref:Uncharacterized protein n=1 Tax=Levilactobacillus hammesii DSM 16381 TaxID=1423753 RepID=A0A0R1UQG4_9LACO|nr:hypothetical protein FD28_GL002379 [Levilactobacillus hammesii DSM 16381]